MGDGQKRRETISRIFLRWLLVIVAAAFFTSLLFTWIHQTSLSQKRAAYMLKTNVNDVRHDILDALNEERFKPDINRDVVNAATNRHVGENGSVIIADEEGTIVSDLYGDGGQTLAELGIRIDPDTMPENEVFHADVYGIPCSCMYIFAEGYCITAILPESEIIAERNSSLITMVTVEILLFLVLFLVIYFLIRKTMIDNLNRVNQSLARITEGHLEEEADVRSTEEFSDLSDGINATVGTLKQYIADASARIDRELAFARTIQETALPSVFPPYPDRTEFSLFAAMDAAKEVGGDFYDFDLSAEHHLAFLIADVSGKGIPAAMFMMKSKAVIRDYAERGGTPEEIFAKANDRLCAGNDSQMFLTAWAGFLETDTGLVHFVNAGHNPPVLMHRGRASFVQQKPNLVLAMMEGMNYREQTLRLEPGDFLYLYTDGVTEAASADGRMFGNDRLLALLSGDFGSGDEACRKIVKTVRESIADFAQGEPQSDDITQLCLYYAGDGKDADAPPTDELTVRAEEDNLYRVLSFVDARLDAAGCREKEKKQIGMAVEEIFVNIANYAYASGSGDAVIRVTEEKDSFAVEITIADTGMPFDPLSQPNPDTKMDIGDREQGGFGIYMVRNAMDDVSYERKDGRNILTLRKKLEE